MIGKIARRSWAFFCFALITFAALRASAGSPAEAGRWKIYYNPVGRYCISYPTRWTPAEAFENAGLLLKPRVNIRATSPAEIDVQVLPATNARSNDTPGKSLLKEAQAHLDSLQTFERAEKVELLEERDMQFVGSAALFVKVNYYDARERTAWTDEIILANRGGRLFRLELTSLADALTQYEPVFMRLAGTFQFDCPARATPLDVHSTRAASAPARPVAQSIELYPRRAIR